MKKKLILVFQLLGLIQQIIPKNKNVRLKLNSITEPKLDHLLELQQKELLCKQLFKTFKKLYKQVKVLTTFILIAISLETLLQVLYI